ncbi:MAG: hypothetical protein WC538_10605 [Thermoanaerobaculia bacterium]|jgi:hypothetical protein
MSIARAIAFFLGFLALDAAAAFVLLVIAGIVAPKGMETSLTIILGALLLAIFVAYAASAVIYARLLSTAAFAPGGRWLLGGLFALTVIVLYAASVVVTLVMFNR